MDRERGFTGLVILNQVTDTAATGPLRTFVGWRANREAAQAGAQVIGTWGWWHWEGGLFHGETRLHHGLETVDKQFRGLAHHVVLKGG